MENQVISKKMQQNGLIVVTLAIFTDMLVYGLVVPILPGYASSLGVSQTAIGLLFACYAIALLKNLQKTLPKEKLKGGFYGKSSDQ